MTSIDEGARLWRSPWSVGRPATGDVVAGAAGVLGVTLGILSIMSFGGLLTLVFFVAWPVTIALPLLASIVLLRPLIGLGRVRARLGHAPARYRDLAWLIGVGFLVAYGAYPGRDDEDGSGLEFLLGRSVSPDWLAPVLLSVGCVALAACVVALALYGRDLRRVTHDDGV